MNKRLGQEYYEKMKREQIEERIDAFLRQILILLLLGLFAVLAGICFERGLWLAGSNLAYASFRVLLAAKFDEPK